nr:hypothetical protein [Micromonospora sp. DSM 115978]
GQTIGVLLAAAGAILLVRAALRCPSGSPEPVDELASLVERTGTSPVAGTLVSLRGRVVGRGGHVTSADLVLADDSGFVPVLYRQPLPGTATMFAFLHADDFVDEEVLVTGWYLRGHRPYVELHSVTS